ncbi:GNAT family N-acetyltransferase [Pseudooctadecabacter sp.]|uniref:GNAT family N-acetyltransferase n=1 Tax=Pseudooctadecabacter sp. TaxID=1966338 RepID=UPI0025E83DFA|nr:GNAT family N-acetyltransferase [Pseudooctadecabacter sp.]
MQIVPLTYPADAARVRRVFDAAADYVMLENGHPPTDATIAEFFTDRPPTVPLENTHHLGMEMDGRLVGVAGFLFGFPDPTDCYIGLMIFDPAHRGCGLGTRTVNHIKQTASARGATRLLIAVLDENPKGRAFWEGQGFAHLKTFAPTSDRHIRHRLGFNL